MMSENNSLVNSGFTVENTLLKIEDSLKKHGLTWEALECNFLAEKYQSPIVPASGCFGFGTEFKHLYDLNCLGSISLKGTTKEKRFGNPLPRIAECEKGIINSVGLQNPGVEEVIAQELPNLKKHFHGKLIANISGFSVEEYVYCAKNFSLQENIGILEINISCPNVHNGGMSYGVCPQSAALVTSEVKKISQKPVMVKLSPNVTDIVEVAKAVEEAGADAISLVNTFLGMRIDIKSRQPIIANKMGGFSGPAIFPIALRMVYQVSKAVKIPVMGLGGIDSADSLLEMMMAGASMVQIGTANLVNPFICPQILVDLPARMKQLGIKKIQDIVGVSH